MHGLKPEHIKHFKHLRGLDITQVAVGEYDLQFHTNHPKGGVSVEGRCEMIDPSGNVIDIWQRGRRSKDFRFLDVLGRKIAGVQIDTPKSFVVTFEDKWSLRFVDDSEQYESFSVGGLFI